MTEGTRTAREVIGVVAIGRNEGERLRRCLESVLGRVAAVVYVDSGSADDSVAMARSKGVDVIELDPAAPFTAARARNAGVHRLRELNPDVAFAQVVDGDCEVIDGWLEAAFDVMRAERDVAIVCGRRREQNPEESVYNRLCDMEWNTPVGEAPACGGDALIRLDAFHAAGGYDVSLIAGEEPELCFRLREEGWRILRIDHDMTWHDARMMRFRQWWTRALRSGHAYAEGRAMHGDAPERFRVSEFRSIIEWAALLPLLALGLAWPTWGLSLLLFGGYVLLWRRIRRWRLREGESPHNASLYAGHCVLSKFPQLIGVAQYWWNRALGRRATLIEYKNGAATRDGGADAQTGPTPMSIMYVGGTLPARSETFVYREVLTLRDLGIDVHLASVHPPERGLGDLRVETLAEEAIEIYGRGIGALLAGASRESLRHPLRALMTMGRAVLDAIGASDVPLRRRPKILWQVIAGLALARRARGRRIGHIHAHMAHVPTTIAMYAARQLGTTFSFTGHAMDIFRAKTLLEAKLRRASFAACISEWHRRFYRKLAPVGEQKLPIVRCGVDVDVFAPADRAGRKAELRILSVGRLVPKKGFDVLIDALAQLGDDANGVRCTIVGDGPERGRLEELVDEHQLGDRVELTGAKGNDEIRGLMRRADLFVLPCRVDASGDRDGIPVVLMEAMACGLCAVSGDLPAIRELIIDGEGGVLAEPGDVSALTGALRELIGDSARRDRLAAAGRQRVVEEFSLSVNVQRLLSAFSRAMKVRRGSDPPAVAPKHDIGNDEQGDRAKGAGVVPCGSGER
ncbi:MAG: glycosyltransferase [Planctomycetota bacterium]|nr:glycosyltransferase [Planctomycetota bacterium]